MACVLVPIPVACRPCHCLACGEPCAEPCVPENSTREEAQGVEGQHTQTQGTCAEHLTQQQRDSKGGDNGLHPDFTSNIHATPAATGEHGDTSHPGTSDPIALFTQITSDAALLPKLAEEALAYAMTHAITMLKHPATTTTDTAAVVPGPTLMHAPMTLLPARLPASLFEQVRALSPYLSLLYDRVSRDLPFLFDTLADTAVHDPFVARLLELLRRVESNPSPRYKRQTLRLAINRSDYMLDEDIQTVDSAPATGLSPRLSLKQVEFNTISCGATSLCNKVSNMHRYLLERFVPSQSLNLPANEATASMTSAMAQAHRLFLVQQNLPSNTPAAVLFLVQSRESNLSDQKMLEYALWENHRIPVRRMTLTDVAREARVDEATGQLWLGHVTPTAGTAAPSVASSLLPVSPPQLISLVYYRAAYTPRDFPSELQWEALHTLERSVAIQCPSLAYHLAGTKKVQQVLALPGALERFIPDSECGCTGSLVRSELRKVFTGLWQPEVEIIGRALASPSRFVLKPQREGGGNNLWGNELVATLREKSLEQLQSYILMGVIGSPATVSRNVPTLKQGRVEMVARAVHELGMVSVMISGESIEGSKSSLRTSTPTTTSTSPASIANRVVIYRNQYAGYLLRTKEASLNEGGLMTGAGAIDSLVLVP